MRKECGIPINFFVNIEELKRYGVPFVRKVFDLISHYDQKIYIHLHPNYIISDDSRFHLCLNIRYVSFDFFGKQRFFNIEKHQ